MSLLCLILFKVCLRIHPDKNKDDEEAKEKFQQLQKVISIFGDEEKRADYDQTGSVDDALSGDVVDNLRDFFKAMYKKATHTIHNHVQEGLCNPEPQAMILIPPPSFMVGYHVSSDFVIGELIEKLGNTVRSFDWE